MGNTAVPTTRIPMRRWAARALRAAAVAATVAVSAALMFGSSAWAPTDVYVEGSLAAGYGQSVGAYYQATTVRTTVAYWTSSASGWPARSDGWPTAGTPCSWTSLRPGQTSNKVIHAYGSTRVCY